MDGSIYGLERQPEHSTTGTIAGVSTRVSDGITARLVVNETGFREAQYLRYQAYLAAGYLRPGEVKLFADSHDAKPSSKSLVMYLDGDPAASVRVCRLENADMAQEGDQLPASAMFKSEIDEFLATLSRDGRSANAVEITRLSRSPRYAKNVALVMGLYHIAGYLILHFEADVIFAAVTKNHTSFYTRMGFRQIAEPKDYPGLDVQTVLMGCLLHEHRGIPGRTLALKDMSTEDDTYIGLMTGEPVPVFGGHATSRSDLVVNRQRSHAETLAA